jgi:hypothetical protein
MRRKRRGVTVGSACSSGSKCGQGWMGRLPADYPTLIGCTYRMRQTPTGEFQSCWNGAPGVGIIGWATRIVLSLRGDWRRDSEENMTGGLRSADAGVRSSAGLDAELSALRMQVAQLRAENVRLLRLLPDDAGTGPAAGPGGRARRRRDCSMLLQAWSMPGRRR